jgi:hypothetical protein
LIRVVGTVQCQYMAKTLGDVLTWKTRPHFSDTQKSLRSNPEALQIMANELVPEHHWVQIQLDRLGQLADRYMINMLMQLKPQ